ncbi:MAG: PAS domain S-box protein, partial [Chloroflexi bacterium]|nr:PAS domain S-box protein [Chloroflexota bacterium]
MAVRERGRLQLLNRVVQNGRRITQLRATETRLKRTDKSEQLLSNAIEQSSEGVAIIDLDGNLLSLNTAFAAMHGYSREEALGRHLSIFHTVEQLPSVALANEQLQATG